jgi:hypothetical protein
MATSRRSFGPQENKDGESEAVRPIREQQQGAGDATVTNDGVRRDKYIVAKLQLAPRHQTKITPSLVKRMERHVRDQLSREAEYARNRRALAQAAGKKE